jgi:hypothetical protein
MPATINGTTGFGGNLSGNVTGNVAGNVTGNSDSATKLSTASGDAPSFACRAWVNFDGTKDTTGATSTANTNRLIRASGNVTSVLRNAAGDYTITFTTPMANANYAVNATGGDWTPATGGGGGMATSSATAPTTAAVRVVVQNSATDQARASVTIFA